MKGFSRSLKKRHNKNQWETTSKIRADGGMKGAGNLVNRRREIVTRVLQEKLKKSKKKK